MPGMIGGIGYDPLRWERLLKQFRSIWADCKSFQTENAFLAAHSFSNAPSLAETKEGWHCAIDGELAFYRHTANFVQYGIPILFQADRNQLLLTNHAKGNCALYLPKENILHLATDDTGSFPLYFRETDVGLLFSSYLRPLARAVSAEPDPVGIIRCLQLGQTNHGRTHFRGIRRLQPGQALVYNANYGTLRVYESSRAWNQITSYPNNELIDLFWETLLGAVDRCLIADYPHAIMCSGGWDSRLLLAAITSKARDIPLIGYFHGHPRSRELAIVKEILRLRQVPIRIEREEPKAYTVDSLAKNFARTECIFHPNWIRAGAVLRDADVRSVSAGVLGEISGGHYGPSMIVGGWRKAANVGIHLFHIDKYIPVLFNIDFNNFESVVDHLRVIRLDKPWYIHSDYWKSLDPVIPQINADLESDLHRIQTRGVQTVDQLIEAYITETRGSQWVTPQLLSCRVALDVTNIYGDRDLLQLASSIPYQFKIHNKFTQAVLRRFAPMLLKSSTAATLIAASKPIMLQEGTRVFRRLYDDTNSKLGVFFKRSNTGVVSGWLDFEFMRNGAIFRAITDSLESECFDRKAINKFIEKISRHEYQFDMYDATQSILRLLSVDLMLR